MGEKIPDDKKSVPSNKVSKENKIEDPTECKNREDLRNCTSLTLNEFCKKQGLRVGGNKTEIMDRVWRYLQGNNSDEDISPRNKPKKDKKINEKHDCYGCTSKGTPCAVAATVEVNGCWFCWRHEENAADIIANKTTNEKTKTVKTEKTEKTKTDSKSGKTEKTKSDSKSGKKKAVVAEDELQTDESDSGKSNKKVTSKKKIIEPEPVVESESEEDPDQQETDCEEEEY